MSLLLPKFLMLMLVLAIVGVASGLIESNKEDLNKTMSGVENPNKTVSNINESEPQEAVKHLIQVLGTDDIDSRKEARITLEKMGEEAVEPLIETFDSENPELKCEAVLALGNIGGQKAEKTLIGLLKDESPEIRTGAAMALGDARSQRAEEELIQALSDEDKRVRSSSAWILGRLRGQFLLQREKIGKIAYSQDP